MSKQEHTTDISPRGINTEPIVTEMTKPNDEYVRFFIKYDPEFNPFFRTPECPKIKRILNTEKPIHWGHLIYDTDCIVQFKNEIFIGKHIFSYYREEREKYIFFRVGNKSYQIPKEFSEYYNFFYDTRDFEPEDTEREIIESEIAESGPFVPIPGCPIIKGILRRNPTKSGELRRNNDYIVQCGNRIFIGLFQDNCEKYISFKTGNKTYTILKKYIEYFTFYDTEPEVKETNATMDDRRRDPTFNPFTPIPECSIIKGMMSKRPTEPEEIKPGVKYIVQFEEKIFIGTYQIGAYEEDRKNYFLFRTGNKRYEINRKSISSFNFFDTRVIIPEN
jgi:hypothetical protein